MINKTNPSIKLMTLRAHHFS